MIAMRPEHSTSSISSWLAALRALVACGSLAYIVLFAVLVCLRVRYPYELEWLEGACVDHVRRVLDGTGLYPAPSLTFVPLTYTPLYFWVSAAVSTVLGVGVLPLRLVSIVSCAGLLAVTSRLVWRETGSIEAGLLAAGLFTAMYGWTGGWLDLGRTDSMFLLLAMSGVYVLRWHDSAAATFAAAVLIALSFLAKQTGLIVAGPLAIWCLVQGWRRFVVFGGTVAIVVIGTTVLLDRATGGWYLYYIYAVPRQHPVAIESIIGFWRYDFLGPLPIAAVLGTIYLLRLVMTPRWRVGVFYLLVASGFMGGAYVSRLHSLSFINVLLPAYLIAAIVCAMAVFDRSDTGLRGLGPDAGAALPAALYLLALVQLGRVFYLPGGLVPRAEDTAAGHALLARIAAVSGDVFVVDHGYLPSRAGKSMHAHDAVMADVIRGTPSGPGEALARALTDALENREFAAIVITDGHTRVGEWLPLETYYRPVEQVVTRRSRFWKPETLYVPK